MSWLLVGIALLAVSLVALLALTQTIVIPVITASIVAAVASPVVAWLQSRRVPRAIGAVLMLLAIIAVGVGMFLMIFGGITAETSTSPVTSTTPRTTIGGWLEDLGIDPGKVDDAKNAASSGASDGFSSARSTAS